MVVSTATETCVQPPSGKTSKSKKSKRSSSSGNKSRSKSSSSSKSAQQAETYYDQPRHAADTVTHKLSSVDDHLYDVVRPRGNGAEDDAQNTYQNVTAADQRAVYQNLDDMYDRPAAHRRHSSKEKKSKKKSSTPLVVQSHYQNLTFDDRQEEEEEDEDHHTYLNIDSGRTYDVPRTDPSSIYDHPRNCGYNGGSSTDYDYPKGLIPLSARLLLNASRKNKDGSVDTDSLPENDSSDEGLTELRSGSSPDEGIGTELDPKGLSAIAEEEETSLTNVVENCYSNLPPLVVQQPSKIKKTRSSKSKISKDLESNSDTNKTHKTSKSRRHHKTDGSGTQLDNSPSLAVNEPSNGNEEKTPQTDRCIEVYHETLRQRNSHKLMKAKIRELVSVQSAKEDSDSHSTIRRMKKLLPSVRALRSQFEPKNQQTGSITQQLPTGNNNTKEPVRKWKSTSNFQAVISCDPAAMEVIERINRSRSNSMGSLSTDEAMSSSASCSSKASSSHNQSIYPPPRLPEESELDHAVSTVSIIQQIIPDGQEKDYDMYRPRHSTAQWNPTTLLEDLYKIQQLPSSEEVQKTDIKEGQEQVINIEGALDKLPSGRRKATFWNAWKRRYFQVKDGQIYCYQNSQSEKPSIILQLVGGQVELDNNMISIDDGKGHYMVVRGGSKVETDRWHQALLSQVNGGRQVQNFVQPRAIEPKLLKEVIVLDLGSSSVRAGILSAQASLPQVFFPSVAAVDKSTGQMVAFGMQATLPEVRSHSTLAYPLRPSNKISKYMLDIEGVTGLIRTAFRQLNVDPSHYGIQVSLPRHLNHATQAELARLLFDEFGLQSVNLTHQSVLSLLSYNSTSGIVVDIGERIDIVPIMDGYMLESGASQVPYGGQQLVDHLRHFLVQQRCSLITEVESYIIRHILEKMAYVAGPDVGSYAIELNKAKSDPSSVRGTVDLRPFSNGHLPWENVSLDLGRFQVTEGLFHPEAWGLDNPGIQKLVHKAIMDCSVDIRKEMVRSIYLSGGITLLPNFPERLEAELNRLTPSHLVPKVHAHPYRYHSSFIGACVLSNSPAYDQSRIKREEWIKGGPETARKWKP